MKLSEITLTTLNHLQISGGNVLHAMKETDPGFSGFGEAYFSWVAQGKVKAWKRHSRMTLNIIVPVGQVRFVFCSSDPESSHEYRVENIGVDAYKRITVPPGIWFGFQGLGAPQSLVLNIASIPHDPNEVERLALSEVKYDWN